MTIHMALPPPLAAAHALERARLADLRRAIADRIEADIALLDALDGDPDLEPSLGSLETVGNEPIFRPCNYPEGITAWPRGDQRDWTGGLGDDLEQDDADSDETAPEYTGDGWQAFRNGGAS